MNANPGRMEVAGVVFSLLKMLNLHDIALI